MKYYSFEWLSINNNLIPNVLPLENYFKKNCYMLICFLNHKMFYQVCLLNQNLNYKLNLFPQSFSPFTTFLQRMKHGPEVCSRFYVFLILHLRSFSSNRLPPSLDAFFKFFILKYSLTET